MENNADTSSAVEIYLQPFLREARDFKRALRVLVGREVRRPQSDCQVEEIGILEVVLPLLRRQKGQQLQNHLHLQSPQG